MAKFVDGKPIQDPSIVERFETEYGITFPADYKAVVLQNDGGFSHLFTMKRMGRLR